MRATGYAFALSTICALACSGAGERTATSEARWSPPAVTASAQPASRPTPTKRWHDASYLAGEGARFTFAWKYREKSGEDEIELRAAHAGDEKILYFVTVGSSGRAKSTLLGMGALVERPDGLYTADVFDVPDDIEKLPGDKIWQLLPRPATVGTMTKVSSPAHLLVSRHDQDYQVAAFERVTVPAGTFDDCVKLAIESRYEELVDHDTVWLAPGVGPVKLARATGRVDELIRFTPGPAPPTGAYAAGTAAAVLIAPASPRLSAADDALVATICAKATCVGPRARVELWRDAQGKTRRVVYDGDLERCSDPPRVIFDANAERRNGWSLKPRAPDEALQLSYWERAQGEILTGLEKSQTIICGRR